MYTYLHHFLQ